MCVSRLVKLFMGEELMQNCKATVHIHMYILWRVDDG